MGATFLAGRRMRYARLLIICCCVLLCSQSQFAVKHSLAVASSSSSRAAMLIRTNSVLHGVARHEQFFSAALGRRMDYWLYLPPDYRGSTARYPVLYMLHGRNANSSQWPALGLFDQADSLIWRGQMSPLLIVTPQGDNGYWMNQANNGPRWGDYVTTDLIAHIDATYRTVPNGQHRAIGGISMGGHGAILLALTHPGLFSAVGGHSPVFRRQKEALPFFGTGAVYQHHDPLSLVRDLKVAVPFRLWLDMGDDDVWLRSTLDFHNALAKRGIVHTWHLLPGGHNAAYWAPHMREYLCWYDASLHGRSDGQCATNLRADSPRVATP